MTLGLSAQDIGYSHWLTHVGKGSHTAPDGSILLQENMRHGDTIEDLIHATYPGLQNMDPVYISLIKSIMTDISWIGQLFVQDMMLWIVLIKVYFPSFQDYTKLSTVWILPRLKEAVILLKQSPVSA